MWRPGFESVQRVVYLLKIWLGPLTASRGLCLMRGLAQWDHTVNLPGCRLLGLRVWCLSLCATLPSLGYLPLFFFSMFGPLSIYLCFAPPVYFIAFSYLKLSNCRFFAAFPKYFSFKLGKTSSVWQYHFFKNLFFFTIMNWKYFLLFLVHNFICIFPKIHIWCLFKLLNPPLQFKIKFCGSEAQRDKGKEKNNHLTLHSEMLL